MRLFLVLALVLYGCNKGKESEAPVDDTSINNDDSTADDSNPPDDSTGPDDSDPPDDSNPPADADSDGYTSTIDCNDNDPTIFPGATEVCDGVDNNCDNNIDEGVGSTWYMDADSDGYGDSTMTMSSCSQPTGYSSEDGDCDDTDANIHPNATEDCSATEDLNCDGLFGSTDNDGDGYGACEECDDTNAAVYPGAQEVCDGDDNDCDGLTDDNDSNVTGTQTWYMDTDGDGYGDSNNSVQACSGGAGMVASAGDCNDTDASISPAASEYCDGVDQDCDGTADDNAVDAGTWYMDMDGDGYGDPSMSQVSCTNPGGVSNGDDCDDSNISVYPGATEIEDGLDNDCNGQIDDIGGSSLWFADVDGDGYGDPNNSISSAYQPAGYVADNTDCDDNDATVNPFATEVADGIDNNCDGQIDESQTSSTWYLDSDGDGYGDINNTTTSVNQPAGYVNNFEDCDDTDATVNPGAQEVSDGIDNNCNGTIDDISTTTTWYLDADGDGYGDATQSTTALNQPTGYVADSSDCDDTDATINPGAGDLTGDGIDNNCNGVVDEANPIWYLDADGDGYGDINNYVEDATQPSGYVSDSTDCDDSSASVNPGAQEVCSAGVDDDCDGLAEEDDSSLDMSTRTTFYVDSDNDGYGNPNMSGQACEAPAQYGTVVTNGDDCDDTNASVNPAMSEVNGNGIDDNCDGIAQ